MHGGNEPEQVRIASSVISGAAISEIDDVEMAALKDKQAQVRHVRAALRAAANSGKITWKVASSELRALGTEAQDLQEAILRQHAKQLKHQTVALSGGTSTAAALMSVPHHTATVASSSNGNAVMGKKNKKVPTSNASLSSSSSPSLPPQKLPQRIFVKRRAPNWMDHVEGVKDGWKRDQEARYARFDRTVNAKKKTGSLALTKAKSDGNKATMKKSALPKRKKEANASTTKWKAASIPTPSTKTSPSKSSINAAAAAEALKGSGEAVTAGAHGKIRARMAQLQAAIASLVVKKRAAQRAASTARAQVEKAAAQLDGKKHELHRIGKLEQIAQVKREIAKWTRQIGKETAHEVDTKSDFENRAAHVQATVAHHQAVAKSVASRLKSLQHELATLHATETWGNGAKQPMTSAQASSPSVVRSSASKKNAKLGSLPRRPQKRVESMDAAKKVTADALKQALMLERSSGMALTPPPSKAQITQVVQQANDAANAALAQGGSPAAAQAAASLVAQTLVQNEQRNAAMHSSSSQASHGTHYSAEDMLVQRSLQDLDEKYKVAMKYGNNLSQMWPGEQ